MSPADNFGLFINILSLIDVFLRLLVWFLPRTQVQELVKMLQTARAAAERAADIGVDVGDIKRELQSHQEQCDLLVERALTASSLGRELLDAATGLTWTIFTTARRVRRLHQDVLVATQKVNASSGDPANAGKDNELTV